MSPIFSVHCSAYANCREMCFGNGKGRRVAVHGDALLHASIHPLLAPGIEAGVRASGSVVSTCTGVLDA